MSRNTTENEDAERSSGGRSPLPALDAFIQKKGLKFSRQREIIAEVFYGLEGHVSVETLVTRVRQRDPHVSVATVYRTMKLLSECGLAVPRQFDDGQTRYETTASRHHDHLICRTCGRIIEFESQRIEELQLQVARSHGFEVENHRLELYGRCADCQQAKEVAP